MSLRVWLPLNGDLHNQGLSDITIINNGATVNTSGKIGSCYEFNASSYLKESTYDWTNFNTSTFSLCCWYKEPSPVASNNSQIICIGTSSGWNNIRFGLLRRSSNGYPMFSVSNGSSYIGYNFTANTFSLDTWNHIAITYDNGHIIMYLNGQFHKEMTTTIVPVLNSSQHLGIGGASNGAEKLTGFLNDVRIYDHALSELEIKEIARAKVLHYPLNHNGMGQPNLISNSVYNSDPWLSAIQAQEIYQGKLAYRISFNILYTKTSNGANDIFNNTITYKENTRYTLSIDWRDDYRTDNKTSSWYLRFFYTDGSAVTQIISPSNTKTEWTHSKMTSNANKTIAAIRTTYGNGGQLYFTNLKLEEGIQDTGYSLPFDESDNIEYDISGYRNNGTKVGTFTYSTDTPKYGISTYISSGNTNYITTPTLQLPGDQITMNFWFKSSNKDPGSSYHMPFEGTANSNQAYEMSIYKTGYLRGGLTIAGTRKVDNCTSTKLTDGNWHMCTMTYDGATIKRYVDATMEKSTSATGALATSSAFVIGHYGSNTSYYCKEAYVSDVRLYTTALSAQDILSLYHNSALVDEQGIVHGAIH